MRIEGEYNVPARDTATIDLVCLTAHSGGSQHDVLRSLDRNRKPRKSLSKKSIRRKKITKGVVRIGEPSALQPISDSKHH